MNPFWVSGSGVFLSLAYAGWEAQRIPAKSLNLGNISKKHILIGNLHHWPKSYNDLTALDH